MATSKLQREQKNIGVIKTSLMVGSALFVAFAYLMFAIMGM